MNSELTAQNLEELREQITEYYETYYANCKPANRPGSGDLPVRSRFSRGTEGSSPCSARTGWS